MTREEILRTDALTLGKLIKSGDLTSEQVTETFISAVKAEDGKQTVGQYVAEVAKKVGAAVTAKGFIRFETGEGLEKKEENFAEEVAKQMGM